MSRVNVRVFGVELATGNTPPGDLRTAAADAARIIEASLIVQTKDESRHFTENQLFAISTLADSVVSLLEAADELEKTKNHCQ